MNWLSLLPLLIQALPDIQAAWNATTTNATMGQVLQGLAKPVGDLLTTIGAELFPQAATSLHIVGGAIAAFNPDYVKWLQGALNTIAPSLNLTPPNLAVDGIYGPLTRGAVEAVQAHFGIIIDGLAGNVTQGWIAQALAKLPQVK